MDKRLSRERKRFRSRYLRRMAARRHRKRFLFYLFFIAGLAFFLWETGKLDEFLFRIREERSEEVRREIEFEKSEDGVRDGAAAEAERTRWTEKYGLSFHFSTGELSFYHEKESEEAQ